MCSGTVQSSSPPAAWGVRLYRLLITDVLYYIFLDTCLCVVFNACIHEDEGIGLLRNIRRWWQFEMEVLQWVMFLNPTLIQTDCSAVLHNCTGRKCPSRWCMAQILIWIDDPWLKQFPPDRWPSHLRAQILAQQHHARIHQPISAVQSGCTSLSVFITATAFWRGLGIRVARLHQFWKKKKMPLNILQQATYGSHSRMKFYCVVNSTWWIWSAAGATLRPLKPITLVSFGMYYLNMYCIMIKSALGYHGVTVRLFP